VNPATAALTDDKYGITYSPSAVTTYILNEGYFGSALWYQPKKASSYTLVGRYGVGDYVGAYCIAGSNQSTYFETPGRPILLTGGAAMAAGALMLGTAIGLTI